MTFKCYYFSFVLYLIAYVSYAQINQIDSLKQALKNTKVDTTQVVILNKLSDKISRIGKLDTALAYATNALQLAQSISPEYKKGESNAYINIGYIYLRKGNNTEALKNYSIALKIREVLNDKKGIANCYNNIGMLYDQQGKYKEAKEKQLEALKIQEKIKDKKGTANSYSNLGAIYENEGNFIEALKFDSTALSMRLQLGDKTEIASSYNSLGNVYQSLGKYPESLKNFFSALKIREEMNDKYGIASCYINMGNVYFYQNNFDQTLKNFLLSLKLFQELHDTVNIAANYNNLAVVYEYTGNYKEALNQNLASLCIMEKTGNVKEIGNSYANLGNLYLSLNNYSESQKYYLKALDIRQQTNDKEGIETAYINLSGLYIKQKKYGQAEEYSLKALKISNELGVLDIIKRANQKLSDIYAATGKDKLALKYYKDFIAIRDSLINKENTEKTVEMKMNYEFEKKEATTKLEQDKKDALALQEKRKQQIITISISIGFVFLLVLAGLILRNLRLNQEKNKIITEQKKLVEQQKEIVEEKHKEISDSINYAERIQRSLLASKDILDKNLKEYFIFFQPKAVVSGDFYWASSLQNGCFAILTADSTGHGVPGAIMSILNISCVEKAVEAEKLVEPAEILNHARTKIIDTLKKDGSIEGGKDGMDCSLVSFDFKTNKLVYAAANNPIWIVRDKEILEFVPDKMPVGKHSKDATSFNQQTVPLQKDDMIYTLTDGMPDQFGGPKGKKYMYKQLKDLLISVSHLCLAEQKEIIINSFNFWKGEQEQVDDITIIGVRI